MSSQFMKADIIQRMTGLEKMRGTNVLLFYGMDARNKLIEPTDTVALYEFLRKLGGVEKMDLIIFTTGGALNEAYRIALLLREYAKRLTVLVPHKAYSAGSLLCLGADELVLGPMAELSPIDPLVASGGSAASGLHMSISSEEIRSYVEMGSAWFGFTSRADKQKLLASLAQRIFPSSLSAIYRADKHVRQSAEQLIKFQLPYKTSAHRKRIVDSLISHYPSHMHHLARNEVRDLGLNVTYSTLAEEVALWEILQCCHQYMNSDFTAKHDPQTGVVANGLIVGREFWAEHRMPVTAVAGGVEPAAGIDRRLAYSGGWRIL